jgi:hypothetical protein
VRVPEIYEIYAADWARFAFSDASVAQAEESVDDYRLFVNIGQPASATVTDDHRLPGGRHRT